MTEKVLTEQGEAAVEEFCFWPHGDEAHSAYPGRVGDRLSDISSNLEDAIAAWDWPAIQDALAELRRLRLALDCCSFLSVRFVPK